MPYVQLYDEIFDESFQTEISQEKAMDIRIKLKAHESWRVTDEPVPNLPILSSKRSVRHPEFYENEK